jgi:hypothetical protein
MGSQPLGNLTVKQSPVEGQAKTWHGVDETSSVSRTYARTHARKRPFRCPYGDMTCTGEELPVTSCMRMVLR